MIFDMKFAKILAENFAEDFDRGEKYVNGSAESGLAANFDCPAG
jgi:hypothetical protein